MVGNGTSGLFELVATSTQERLTDRQTRYNQRRPGPGSGRPDRELTRAPKDRFRNIRKKP